MYLALFLVAACTAVVLFLYVALSKFDINDLIDEALAVKETNQNDHK